jgi:hypothetical protein
MAEKPEPHFGEASDQESTYGEDTPVRVSKNDAVATEDTSNTGTRRHPGRHRRPPEKPEVTTQPRPRTAIAAALARPSET